MSGERKTRDESREVSCIPHSPFHIPHLRRPLPRSAVDAA